MVPVLDENVCTNCRRCVRACVAGVFAIGADGFTAIRDVSRCIGCGHCLSVCPSKAIALDGLEADSLQAVEEASLTERHRDMLFKSRRSIRAYDGQPVEREALERALHLVNWAPTARNHREVGWLVVNGREKIEPLLLQAVDGLRKDERYAAYVRAQEKGRDVILRGAPCVVLAHAAPWEWAEVDCSIAMTYLELALHSMGLGTCWCGVFIRAANSGALKSLPLPEGHKIFAGLMVGRPALRYLRVPPREPAPVSWL